MKWTPAWEMGDLGLTMSKGYGSLPDIMRQEADGAAGGCRETPYEIRHENVLPGSVPQWDFLCQPVLWKAEKP